MGDLEDRDLIDEALAGDPASRRALVERLLPTVEARVRHVLLRYRPREQAAQVAPDLTQHVFMLLFEDSGRRLRAWSAARGAALRTFVALVAEREVLAILRRGRRNPWTEAPTEHDELALRAGSAPDHEAHVANRQWLNTVLDRALRTLDERGLLLFQRLVVDEAAVDVVAQEMGATPGALYMWKSRFAKLVAAVADEVGGEAKTFAPSSIEPAHAGVEGPVSAQGDRLLALLGERARARAAEARELQVDADSSSGWATADDILAALDARGARDAGRSPRTRRLGLRSWGYRALAIGPLAAAAAVALVFGVRGGSHAEPGLGEYVASVTGHVETTRGVGADEAFTWLEARDGALEPLIVRPQQAVHAPVVAVALVVRGATSAALDVTPEVSELGVVRFDVPGERLKGASEVRVVIALPAKLPAALAAASGADVSVEGAVVVRVPVRGAAPPSGAGEEKN